MFSSNLFRRYCSFGKRSGVWLACVLALGVTCGRAQAADALLGPVAAKTIPMADAHFHVMTWMDIRELAGYMDRNGVRWAGGVAVGSGQGAPGARQSKLAETVTVLGSLYIRATGMALWISLYSTLGATALEKLDTPEVYERLSPIEEDLRRGARVIGEIHVNALSSTKDPAAQIKTKADSPIVKALFALAGKYKRLLNIHAQWDSDTVQEVERLAESNRNARLVIAHAGSFAIPAQIHAVFQRQTNVSCDLSVRSIPPLQDRHLIHTAFDDRTIRENWKKLIEAYPDRFVVGVDNVYSWEEYEKVIRAIRFGLLANLSPATAEKVAYRNAQAWFGLE